MKCTYYDYGCSCTPCMFEEARERNQKTAVEYMATDRAVAKAKMAALTSRWQIPPVPPPPIPSVANVSGSGKFIPTKNGGWFWKPDDEAAKEPPATTRSKLEPQTCLTCKTVNEYAGPEHLQANGTYICRSCRSH